MSAAIQEDPANATRAYFGMLINELYGVEAPSHSVNISSNIHSYGFRGRRRRANAHAAPHRGDSQAGDGHGVHGEELHV